MFGRCSFCCSLAARWFLAVNGALLASALGFAADAPPPVAAKAVDPSEYECRFVDAPITIDGKADEAAWKDAVVVDRFALPWLGEKARAARTATRARLLWDRQYLYFFAEMDDADLTATVKEHNGPLWTGDVFELFLKPASDKDGYYEFEFNPAGAVLDCFFPKRNDGGFERFKNETPFEIRSAVSLRGTLNEHGDKDQGWSVEGRIAWKSLARTGGRPEVGQQWKFALCRYDYTHGASEPELSTHAPLREDGKPNFHHYEEYLPIRFTWPAEPLSGLRAAGIAELAKLTTLNVSGSPESPTPYRAVKAFPKLDLRNPIFSAPQPGSDRLLIINQKWSYGPYNLVRIKDDPLAAEVETLQDGLKGVAYSIVFHPKFVENGFVYLGRNMDQPAGAVKRDQVMRYRIDPKPPYAFHPESETLIIDWETDGHNGLGMAFGNDGMFYVTSGDGTSDSDRWLSGQDMSRPLAKVLRIDVDHPAEGKQYSVPKDNPYVGQKDVVPETWACGLRNPWRLSCDPVTGAIYCGNNGQDLWEQVFLIEKGANYGWSIMEGSHDFYRDRKRGPQPFTPPLSEHHHSEMRSLTGGIVYRGTQFPDLVGAYVYGDYSTGKLFAIRHQGQKLSERREIAGTPLQITSITADTHGELLISDHGKGGFYRLERRPTDEKPQAFPRKLSETGLFASIPRHEMAAGIVPYSVNAELWSDGAHKARFIAIPHRPGQDMRIEYTGTRGWKFPDEAVIVKSFALERTAGDPASRRWIETRILVKQTGEWTGYTYEWNDEQTDGVLVEKNGVDREYAIRDPSAAGGERKQAWHYPSRAECLVCHSRAANFVLGLSTLQMNCDHDYGGGRIDNQLRVLERLGLLKTDYRGDVEQRFREDAKAKGISEEEKQKEYAQKLMNTADQREFAASGLLMQSPEALSRLVDPYDTKAELAARARSYLHANCAICHVEAGGGNAQMDLEQTTSLAKMNLIDVAPLHHKFDLADPRLIAAKSPERSVLLKRMSIRGPLQMPPMATTIVDERAVKLLSEWIAQQEPLPKEPEAKKP